MSKEFVAFDNMSPSMANDQISQADVDKLVERAIHSKNPILLKYLLDRYGDMIDPNMAEVKVIGSKEQSN
jgi:hypothetical protein